MVCVNNTLKEEEEGRKQVAFIKNSMKGNEMKWANEWITLWCGCKFMNELPFF